MAGFVKNVIQRAEAVEIVARELAFPWPAAKKRVSLEASLSGRLAADFYSAEPYPPYSRSLRDGYAVQSLDVSAATPGTPTFLKKIGEVPMGELPSIKVTAGTAVSIPTGAALPEGADAVVMLEDTETAGEWVEVRKGVQGGENIIHAGEEISTQRKLLSAGDLVDFRVMSVLAALGTADIELAAPRVGVLSTGDEIVPVDTKTLPPGAIRDANGYAVRALLSRYGFDSAYRGIVSDDGREFEERIRRELDSCDVLVLSGGSSVGTRDHSARVLEMLPAPGLIVRGINMVPGKPTLAAGSLEQKKLVVSLPGHPLSCLTACFVFLLPLLLSMTGAGNEAPGGRLRLELAGDITARTGPEEFVPCRVMDGKAVPLPAKSGYISALGGADGFIRIPEDMETLRAGEIAEVWTW